MLKIWSTATAAVSEATVRKPFVSKLFVQAVALKRLARHRERIAGGFALQAPPRMRHRFLQERGQALPVSATR